MLQDPHGQKPPSKVVWIPQCQVGLSAWGFLCCNLYGEYSNIWCEIWCVLSLRSLTQYRLTETDGQTQIEITSFILIKFNVSIVITEVNKWNTELLKWLCVSCIGLWRQFAHLKLWKLWHFVNFIRLLKRPEESKCLTTLNKSQISLSPLDKT